ncbi:helix-turn-helix domain-containing protein [Streptococcus thoraltensis]|uniref:helix-turn-helix domain-containing protein n=1 Tax=Streptococcus thoraltensis TaxID=55085 RepID=UPI0003816CB2|nr:helix-turn-helix transcriptional regulator [Streptococcus thoraltensis]
MENNVKIFKKPPTRIRKLISESGKKLKEISNEADIPYGALSSYNQGIRTPKKENAKILADYFGVSVPYLLGYEKEPNLIKAEPIIPLELVQELSSINDKKEKILQEYLELGKREQVILKQIREDL